MKSILRRIMVVALVVTTILSSIPLDLVFADGYNPNSSNQVKSSNISSNLDNKPCNHGVIILDINTVANNGSNCKETMAGNFLNNFPSDISDAMQKAYEPLALQHLLL